ncbi:lysoplasmalogenase family protein [Tenacibaculum amylolyticum]|uniref:lysoplasmalogenase family protein n=1 Tax=Tenacibaculum amylolyticum TaxID=104269 RepID=UPI0038B61353
MNINLEFAVKIIALFSLSFLYLETTTKVNHWYVIILLFSIISDSLFIFETFYYPALYFLIVNRFLYLVIIRKSIFPYAPKKIFLYSIPILLAFLILYLMIYEYMKDIRISAFIMGVISVFLILFTFLNFLKKNNKRAKYFFLGTSLMPFADVLMAISYYIDSHTTYIIIYHYMYYIARYLIYKSMVTDKKE